MSLTQTCWPSSDQWKTGSYLYLPASPATFWSKVVDDPADEDTTYVRMTSGGYQWCYLDTLGFSLPYNAEAISIAVYIRAKKTGMNVSKLSGGMSDGVYPTLAVASAPVQLVPSTLWSDFTFSLPQNEIGPFQPWTADAVNAINCIIIRQEANTAGTGFTQVYAVVTYDVADLRVHFAKARSEC